MTELNDGNARAGSCIGGEQPQEASAGTSRTASGAESDPQGLQADSEAAERRTADRSSGPHVYLSTGCLHGEHGYCQGDTGLSGAKRPASCKFCQAPCTCPCHQQTPDRPTLTKPTPARLREHRSRLITSTGLEESVLRERAETFQLYPEHMDVWQAVKGIDYLLQDEPAGGAL